MLKLEAYKVKQQMHLPSERVQEPLEGLR